MIFNARVFSCVFYCTISGAVVDLVLSAVIPFLIKNTIVIVIFIVCLNLNTDFGEAMIHRFHCLKKLQHCSMDKGRMQINAHNELSLEPKSCTWQLLIIIHTFNADEHKCVRIQGT